MAFEHRLNTGTMWFRAEKKTEKSPDFSGEVNVEGKKYFLSAWNKTTPAGQEYISIMVKLKDHTQAPYVEPGDRPPVRSAPAPRQQPVAPARGPSTQQPPPAQQPPSTERPSPPDNTDDLPF